MPESDPEGAPRIVALKGAPNFRDLGGYRTDDGRAVRTGLLFRSGHLANLTDDDVQRLKDLGLRTVVDLRHQYEVGIFGRDRLPTGARYVSLPIPAASMDVSVHEAMRRGEFSALPDLTEASRRLVRHSAGTLGELLRLVSDPARMPLVFHCIGGKDRTGVASALILAILGVPWETIRTDYLRTNELLDDAFSDRLDRLARIAGTKDDFSPTKDDLDAARRFFIVQPSYIDAALEEIVDIAGSVGEYARSHLGIDGELLDRLRSELLEPARADSERMG